MRRAEFWPGLVWLGVSLPAFWVLPALDDWGATAPLTRFDWAYLEPGLFWRPFEQLGRFLVGRFPSLYPQLPHGLSVVGHGVSAWLVHRLALRLEVRASVAAVAAALFLVHPGGVSVAWSVDGPIRAWSTACGLGATLAYLGPARRIAVAGWLALGALASLWYEPGLRWFLVAPLVGEFQRALAAAEGAGLTRAAVRRLVLGLTVGVSAVAAYLLVRWMPDRELLIFGTGRYGVTTSPVTWLRNAAMLTGVALAPVDTIALLGPVRNSLAVGTSLLAGLPLIVLTLRRCRLVWTPPTAVLAALAVAAVLAPHLPQAHVSEFYAHPAVGLIAILSAAAYRDRAPRRTGGLGVALALFVVGCLAVDAHKAAAMIRTGRSADRVGRAVVALFPEPPTQLCVVTRPPERQLGYSVFVAPPGPASDWGMAARGHWGWDREVQLEWVTAVEFCSTAAIVEMSVDGTVTVVGRAPAQSTDGRLAHAAGQYDGGNRAQEDLQIQQ